MIWNHQAPASSYKVTFSFQQTILCLCLTFFFASPKGIRCTVERNNFSPSITLWNNTTKWRKTKVKMERDRNWMSIKVGGTGRHANRSAHKFNSFKSRAYTPQPTVSNLPQCFLSKLFRGAGPPGIRRQPNTNHCGLKWTILSFFGITK